MFSGARVVWPGPVGYRDKGLYARFWQIVEHYQIAAMSAVPTVYGTLAQVPVDTNIAALRLPIVARPRCPPRCAGTSPRTPGGTCWKATD